MNVKLQLWSTNYFMKVKFKLLRASYLAMSLSCSLSLSVDGYATQLRVLLPAYWLVFGTGGIRITYFTSLVAAP